MVYIDAVEGKTIPLGQQGEANAITVVFPINDWYAEYGEGGTFTLSNKRSCDPDGYECEVTADDDYAYWVVREEDASCKGKGKCELVYKKQGLIAKSAMYTTWVDPALNADPVIPPAWENWVQRMKDDVSAIEDDILLFNPEMTYSEDSVKAAVQRTDEELNGLEEMLEETLPELDDLFIAEYDVTTADEILEAVNANKTVVLKVEGENETRYAALTSHAETVTSETSDTTHAFTFTIILPKVYEGKNMISETCFDVTNAGWTSCENMAYTKEVSDADRERIVSNEDDILVIQEEDLPEIREYILITPEEYDVSDWTRDETIAPFRYKTTFTAEYEIGSDTQVELINNDACAFATYGFSVGEVNGQQVSVYAMDRPLSTVTLRIEYRW